MAKKLRELVAERRVRGLPTKEQLDHRIRNLLPDFSEAPPKKQAKVLKAPKAGKPKNK